MRICLLTPAQPSINPRLVKEADALSDAGHQVQVICTHFIPWADEADKVLLLSRKWSCIYVGGYPWKHSLVYYWTRLRNKLAMRAIAKGYSSQLMLILASGRVVPELLRAARTAHADLYIAHNLAALMPAVTAAKEQGVKAGFDAEDFHSGMDEGKEMTSLIEVIEKEYLPQCDYLTAGSPDIAEAYAEKYGIPAPTPILNVFPLSEQPTAFRPTEPSAPLTLYWFSQTIGANRGLEDVIRAMGLLPECDIELHLRGNWQAGYKEQLFKLASSVGVSHGKVKDYPPRPADEMVTLAANYDVGLALEQAVDLNRTICLTNKIFTYLLGGNAVIATATKAQRALTKTIGEAGFSYELGDTQALATHLKHWYNDRASLDTARRQSWEHGALRYNWDVEKHKFLQVIDNALHK